MHKLAKSGLALVAMGAVACGFPLARYDYPTHVPLSAPFPTGSGAVLRQEFKVRTSESYSLRLGCRDASPLKYSLSDLVGGGSNSPALPCDIRLRLLRGDEVIQSEHLHVLRPASFSNWTGYWHMAYVHIPSAGRYTLELTNRSDLTSLAANGPVVDMDIGATFYRKAIYSKLLGTIVAAPLALSGAVLFALGLRRVPPAEAGDPPNEGPAVRSGESALADGPPSVR